MEQHVYVLSGEYHTTVHFTGIQSACALNIEVFGEHFTAS